MEKGLEIFENSEFGKIRVKLVDGVPMFVANDIAKSLGYEKPQNAVATHCKSGDALNYNTAYIPHSNGIGGTKVIVIGESNVYRLIMRSNLPSAEKFQDWVCEEVLPSIRKTGMYSILPSYQIEDPIKRAEMWIEEQKEKQLALKAAKEAKEHVDRLIHDSKTYTSGEIAKELNLKSAIELNNILKDKHIQFKQNGTWLLYAKYADLGYTSTKQFVLDNGRIEYDRRWTGKGRDFILNLFKDGSR